MEVFVPPKPKEFFMTALNFFEESAYLDTTWILRGISVSGSSQLRVGGMIS